MDSRPIDVLPGPSTRPPALAAPHLSACTARPARSEMSTRVPRDESESICSRTCGTSVSGVDVDVTHDCECVRSPRQLSANVDSECGIEDWASGCASYAGSDIMRTRDDDES